jgi:hypothetical protein
MAMKQTRFWWAAGMAAMAMAAGLPAIPVAAQTTPGITLWGGDGAQYRLRYYLQYNTPNSFNARYYLRVSADKVEQPVSSLRISYPSDFVTYGGEIDINQIQVREGRRLNGGNVIEVEDIVVTPEANRIEIFFVNDIPPETAFQVVISRIKNPRVPLLQNFNLEFQYAGDYLPVYVGSWNLDIASASSGDN